MAYNFSANQYENSFRTTNLHHWEIPKWYPPRPRQRIGSTRVIANDRGHLFPEAKGTDKCPWPEFKSTHQFPRRITRKFADEYNEKLVGKNRWSHFKPKPPICPSDLPLNLEYIPGDLTDPKDRHPSRELLLQQKEDHDSGLGADLELNELHADQPICEISKDQSSIPPLPGTDPHLDTSILPAPNLSADDFDKMSLTIRRSVTEKPNVRVPSPVVPAYANFALARRMHQDNLDHQPLPDCIADHAYRKLQANRHSYPGIGLDVEPIATGVGLKTYNAGPTHCTKMKVYRPKTCGVIPKKYGNNLNENDLHRPMTSSSFMQRKKMNPMELAICWDYEPLDPRDEPPPPRHIDGTNDSGGPAVFNYVKSPRTPPSVERGRSAGVFTNTFGEPDFFDKDLIRKKADFTGRLPEEDPCHCTDSHHLRAKSLSRDISSGDILRDRRNLHQSSPNLSRCHLDDNDEGHFKENLDCMRNKVLGSRSNTFRDKIRKITNPSFFRRPIRLCHKVAPDPGPCCKTRIFRDESHDCHHHHHSPPRRAFLAGIPRHNAAGNMICANHSGCSSGGSTKVLVVPKQRNPYSRKNYNIETLVPPFTSYRGGACQGGYPEHWRLASVYQHAYKPLEQRKKSLLQTVYK